MHILVVSQYYPPDMGGGATRAHNVVKGLINNGCRVTVVSAFPHYPDGIPLDEFKWKPFIIEYNGSRNYRTIIPPLSSRGVMNRVVLFLSFVITSLFPMFFIKDYDAVWAANPNIFSTIPAYIYSRKGRCPFLSNIDDIWAEGVRGRSKSSLTVRVMNFLGRMFYNKSSYLTPISSGYIKSLNYNYHVPEEKMRVVPGGVDLTLFKKTENITEKDKFTVLYIGAFSTAYNFDQVLKAAEILKPQEDIEFIIRGGGELYPTILKKRNEMNLENTKIINKIISREEVAIKLQEADALLLPLKRFRRPYMGLSSKLYEYQAAAKPIICIAEGVPSEFVRETRSGLTIEPDDHEALAEAVLFLKDNPEAASNYGRNGRVYVEDNVALDQVGSLMLNLIKNSIESGKEK